MSNAHHDDRAATRRDALRRRWPLPEHPSVVELLLDRYASPDRGYHDLRHLTEVLDRLAELSKSEDFDSEPVLLAAWFHDSVYDGQTGTEDRSAQLAARELGAYPHLTEVIRLVRLTMHHIAEPGDGNGAALCDADLAILAATPTRYAEYAADVRREYAHLPAAVFAAARAEILSEFAARKRLFHTDYAHRHWDAQARRNLAGEVAALREESAQR